LRASVKAFMEDNTGTASNAIALTQVYFKQNAADLDAVMSAPELDNLVTLMTMYSTMVVELSVYDGSSPDQAAGTQIAQLKSDAIKNYLVSKGVSAARVATKGFAAAEGGNARIELKILSK
jgi:OOP family OmpA-OmpF porin